MDHYYYPCCSGLSVEKRAKPIWTTSRSSSCHLEQLVVWIISDFSLSYWRSLTAITENVRPQMKREKNTLKLRGAAGKTVLCLWRHSVYCKQIVRSLHAWRFHVIWWAGIFQADIDYLTEAILYSKYWFLLNILPRECDGGILQFSFAKVHVRMTHCPQSRIYRTVLP